MLKTSRCQLLPYGYYACMHTSEWGLCLCAWLGMHICLYMCMDMHTYVSICMCGYIHVVPCVYFFCMLLPSSSRTSPLTCLRQWPAFRNSFLIFLFFFLSLVDLQCYVSFRCTAKLFCYTHTSIYSFSNSFIGYYKTLSIAPCAILGPCGSSIFYIVVYTTTSS